MSRAAATPELSLPRLCTAAEYFDLAAESAVKLEYRGGPMFPPGHGWVLAMAGGSVPHGRIIGNVGGELRSRTRGTGCEYLPPDVRVGVRDYPTYTYTDGHVVCGPPVLDDRDRTGQTVMNSRLIVEVLSPGTEGYDLGKKLARYMSAESLQQYVVVDHDRPWVLVITRQADGTWSMRPYAGLDKIVVLGSIRVELPMAEIYLNVTFPPAEG